jgi:twinkle protein
MGEGKRAEDIPKAQRLNKSREEIQAEIDEIGGYPVVDLVDRRLRADVLGHYGIKIGISEADGRTPAFQYFPYYKGDNLVAYKVKLLAEKRFWCVGELKDADLFGWKQAKASGSRRLIITEGENDAVALKRIFDIYEKDEYRDTIPAVVSVPTGAAAAAKVLSKKLPEIRKFFKEEDIALCFDADGPGQDAINEVCKIMPHCKVITLPCKDANACLIEGKGKQAYQAAKWKAEKAKNSRLVWLDDVWEDAKKPAEWGVSWPWKDVTEATRGIRKGETIYIGAAQKMGKSELLNQIAAHLVAKHDWKILLAKPEEANVKTAKLLAGKIAHAKFHDPKIPFDAERYEKAGQTLLGKKVCMLNLYQHLDWEVLKGDIRAAKGEGVDAVFIDPITNLTNGMNAADANTKLQEIAQELAAMAKDLDIVIFIFCHLRNPESGTPHDRGGSVLTSQFAGSRAMGRSCNYMFGIEGNKDPELPEEERNIRTLVLLDDREYGEVGKFPLYWDNRTTMFNQM